MKKNLLSLALLAGLTASSANAAEFYLIKDGKLQEGVEVLAYDNDSIAPVITPDATFAGETAYSIKTTKQYNDTRFYVANGIDIAKYWNVEIEFGFEEGGVNVEEHAGGNKWAVMEIGIVDDTVGGKYGIDAAFSRRLFDVKVKNQPGVWNIEKQMLVCHPYETSFKEVVFAWQRQIADLLLEAAGPVFIKNLKFTGEGNRPFFAEDYNGLSAAHTPSVDNYQTYVVKADGTVEFDKFRLNNDVLAQSNCALPLYVSMEAKAGSKQKNVSIKRMWEDLGTDGSQYYDVENTLAIAFTKVATTKAGRNGRTFYLIPAAGLENAAGFKINYICKWDGTQSKEGLTPETSADSLVMNVKYAFVDDAVEAATCDLKNAFNDDDFLNGSWTEYGVEVPNELAGKKYIALVFDKPVFFSYVVDNITIAAVGEGFSLAHSAAPVCVDANTFYNDGETPAEIWAIPSYSFGTVEGGVNNIINNAKVNVYPVPATDVVSVANEGVEKVEVVNAAGAVVASANGNQVNVAAIANGIYVVKAYTAEGILVAKIVKK